MTNGKKLRTLLLAYVIMSPTRSKEKQTHSVPGRIRTHVVQDRHPNLALWLSW